MRRSVSVVMWAFVLMAMIAVVSPPAFGQGTSAALSGVVVDASGGVLPGVDVVAKSNATGNSFQAVTDSGGRFTIPALQPGIYTLTISLTGFKTLVLPDVQLVTGTPGAIKATLDLGKVEETVIVTGATEIVQTQSATVATTIAVKQIQQLPVISHTALDFLVSLAGVETSSLNFRGSTINGLPTTAINITLDGINVQDKRGSEGMFMYIRPMMDSVEEITISTSNPEAASTGAGGATIRMETRSGTNRFSGSAYNTWRNQAGTDSNDTLTRKNHPGWLWSLNTPYWFNKRDQPRTAAGDYYINDVRLQTPGFRLGGPVLKDKLFYFFNYEEFRLPQSIGRTRYILSPAAQLGSFTYVRQDNGQNQTVNLLTIAANSRWNQTTTVDPTIAKLLADIRQAAATEGSISTYDLNVDQYSYSPSSTQLRKFPTVRLDYNLTNAHRLTFSYRYNMFDSTPDFLNSAESRFPGFPNYAGQYSQRYMWQVTERATFGKNIVNEARVGASDAMGLGTYFGKGVTPGQFNCSGLGCQSAGGIGWNFTFPSGSGNRVSAVDLSGPTAYGGSSAGVAPQMSFEDTLTWLKGRHSISVGASFARTTMRNWNSTPYPGSLSFGTSSSDTTAYNMLDSTNTTDFPGGMNSTYSGYARNMYGFLTGRVTGYSGTYYLQPDGTYKINGDRTNATRADDIGFFVSDSWRAKPNLTVSLGLRYQVQLPMTSDGLYTRPQTWQMVYGITGAGSGLYGSGNLYQGGRVATGTNPILVKYEDNRPAYNTDWNNLAPSLGVNWRPNLKSGFLSKLLSTDPVIRGGYSLTYTKLGTDFFDSNYSGNPGRSRAGARSATSGTPLWGSDGWPVLLRDTSRMTPSATPATLVGDTWTLTPSVSESIDIHYPNWSVPSTHQYSFGIQRELGKSMALDVRYVGNINTGGWTSWNMNSSAQWSMLAGENGFYDEFRKAQANLRANIVANQCQAGVTSANCQFNFAYTGAPGTSPLPIFMAYFAGIPLGDARNLSTANYTSANYRTSSWYNSLSMYNPALTTISGTGTSGLQNAIGTGTGLDLNRMNAGVPINFFIANPAVAQGSAYLETTAGNTKFNALQIELRRRMSGGFLVAGSYQYMFGRKTWEQRSLRENWFYVDSTGGYNHAIKANWVYELPFGQGKKFGRGVGRLGEMAIGGWEFDGVARLQSGAKFNLGNYRLVGMTEKDLQDAFKLRYTVDSNGLTRIYMFPQDIIDNSILANYTQSATTASGYAGALPTGRYLAPTSGPDCVQYLTGQCPGTAMRRIISGPWFWKIDFSFVKRIAVYKNMRIEGRMDLFNVFDTINFTPNTSMGSSVINWQVTGAAADNSNSQDPGGRITQFSLRFSW